VRHLKAAQESAEAQTAQGKGTCTTAQSAREVPFRVLAIKGLGLITFMWVSPLGRVAVFTALGGKAPLPRTMTNEGSRSCGDGVA
jgi:hypothetical protein